VARADALYKQAQALEKEGGDGALNAYHEAARAGSGKAAVRLGDVYDKGLLGAPRDYAESLRWYNAARVQGEDVPVAKGMSVAMVTTRDAAGLYAAAQALETQGKGEEAVRVYQQAARSGSGKAALRLGDIYDKGLLGIPRDYAESLKWYNAARVLGEQNVPIPRGR
jgi:TPR repeat protein